MKVGVELSEIALFLLKRFVSNELCCALRPKPCAPHVICMTVTEDNFRRLVITNGVLELSNLLACLNNKPRVEHNIARRCDDDKGVAHAGGAKNTVTDLVDLDRERDQFCGREPSSVISCDNTRQVGNSGFSRRTCDRIARAGFNDIPINPKPDCGECTQTD